MKLKRPRPAPMNLATHSLLPPPPDQQLGWGRVKWILLQHSTASMELKLGFGALFRGLWQVIQPETPPAVHDSVHFGIIPLSVWGAIVAILGLWQMLACMYRWDWQRTMTAIVVCGLLAYICMKYLIYDPSDIAIALYFPLLVGEAWISMRGTRIIGENTTNGGDK